MADPARRQTSRSSMDDPSRVRPSTAGPALHPWLVVLALAPGVFLTLADATVMSVAVPLIIRRLEGSVISVSWVMNGYNLVLAVLFLTMGRLADRYGHKLRVRARPRRVHGRLRRLRARREHRAAHRLARGAGGRRRGRGAHGARPAAAGVPG